MSGQEGEKGMGGGRGGVLPLSSLVHHKIFPIDNPCDASKGLTSEVWCQMIQAGTVRRVKLEGQKGVVES